MKTNYLKTFVATMMLLCCLPGHAYEIDGEEYADLYEGGLYYVITSTDDKTCAVYHSPYVDGATIPYDGNIEIPSYVTYEGQKYTVTSIGLGAFCQSQITSVSIPNTVTSIGPSAFAICRGLTSITIPNSVTSIDDEAFDFCDGLTSINIPSSVTSIGDKAFHECSGLTSITVDADNKYYDSREDCNAIINTSTNELLFGCSNSTIPYTVTRIGNRAFDETGLSSIYIPTSVKSIGNGAFGSCHLTSVTIPSSVTTIGASAFWGCRLLETLVLPDDITSIGDYAFAYCEKLAAVNIPSKLTSIGVGIFEACGLRTATIPSKVTSIGQNAFAECKSLTSITIPNSVTSIGDASFYDCISLKSISIPNSVTSIERSAFANCGFTTLTIPSSVTSIGDYAFACSKLTSITVDADNKYYDSRNNCNAIIKTSTNELITGCSTTTIPYSVTSIGNWAFTSCTNLKSLTIPNSVTNIGKYAFQNCSKLTYLSLPRSLASIPYNIMPSCASLTSVTVNNPNVVTVPSDFYEGYGTSKTDLSSCTLYVPAESVDAYKAATGWKQFGTITAIPSTGDYSIYTNAFTAKPGNQVKLSVQMNNATPVCDWQADMVLPTGFTLAQDNDGNDLVCMTTDRTSEANHSIVTKTQTDGSIRILEASASNALFEGTNGKVASITLNVADDVTEGEYYIEFKNVVLTEPTASHDAGTAICKVNVKDFTTGDVNNDASLNVADLAQVVNFIMESETSDGCIDGAADVNGDGDINGVDYIAEVNAIMSYSANAKSCNIISKTTSATGSISSNAVLMGKGANGTMNIYLSGSDNKSSLIQFDVTLPKGISIAENGAYINGANGANHEIAVERVYKNTYRVMMYSASLAKIAEENNGIISLSIVADNDMAEGTYNAAITGQLVVDANGNYNKAKSSSAQITISDATAINEVANTVDGVADVYTADGKLVHKNTANSLAKGMYISGGKKIIVK